jgi:hypothetical protein
MPWFIVVLFFGNDESEWHGFRKNHQNEDDDNEIQQIV